MGEVAVCGRAVREGLAETVMFGQGAHGGQGSGEDHSRQRHSKCKGPEVSRSSEWPVGQRGMDRGQWVGWRLGGGSEKGSHLRGSGGG